jgi:hypothetical protein
VDEHLAEAGACLEGRHAAGCGCESPGQGWYGLVAQLPGDPVDGLIGLMLLRPESRTTGHLVVSPS